MKKTSQFKSLFTATFLLSFSLISFAQQSPQLPSVNMGDGECYAKFVKPATYEDVTKKILVKEATQKTERIPAQYETVNEQALVTPEHIVKLPVAAVYETVEEKVMIKPERKKLKKIPAEYETVTEQILIKEAATRYVPVPAVYETVAEKILIEPESKKLAITPETYQDVTEQIITKEAGDKMIPISPEFEDVTEQYIITPASTKTLQLEPQYKSVSEVIEVQPASTKWVFRQGDKNCLSANPEDCRIWCLEEIPAKYQTIIKKVNMGCDGSGVENSGCSQTVEVPATYGTRTKRVLKTPAQSRPEAIPAEYTQLVKSVVASPAATSEEIIPAVYKTIQKQIVKVPATFKEEIIPAIYETITKKIIKTPETIVEEIIPAEYTTITKQVLKSSASTTDETVPATYETIAKKIMAEPARESIVTIPEEYDNITEKKLIQEAEIVWRRVICEKHLIGEMGRKIQQGLKDAGFDPGPIDNIIGPRTKAAIRRFQLSKNLYTGPIDFETAYALGIEVPNYEPPKGKEAIFYAENADTPETKVIAVTGIAEAPTGNEANKAKENTTSAKEERPADLDKAAEEKQVQDDVSKTDDAPNDSSEEKQDKEPASKKENTGDTGGTTMSSKEVSMLEEINLMRADPAGYIPHVEAYLKKIQDDAFWDDSYKNQEKTAAMELIAELKELGTLSQLKAHQGLYDASVKHGEDLKQMGRMSHVGSDGRHPYQRVQQEAKLSGGTENLVGGGVDVRESVIMLLVDSGIPNRGHRRALLDPKWTYASCHEVGMVGEQNDSWVQMFGVD